VVLGFWGFGVWGFGVFCILALLKNAVSIWGVFFGSGVLYYSARPAYSGTKIGVSIWEILFWVWGTVFLGVWNWCINLGGIILGLGYCVLGVLNWCINLGVVYQ
jgi:hypothetical protein